eukprot:scaffold9131_cov47-Phaeocystis_antarctica.AAC.2
MRTGEHTNRELTATGFAKQVLTLALALARALAQTLTLSRTLTPNPNPKQDRTHDVETVAQRASQIEQLLKSGAKQLLSSEQARQEPLAYMQPAAPCIRPATPCRAGAGHRPQP